MQVHILIENKSEKRFNILVEEPNYTTHNKTGAVNGTFGLAIGGYIVKTYPTPC